MNNIQRGAIYLGLAALLAMVLLLLHSHASGSDVPASKIRRALFDESFALVVLSSEQDFECTELEEVQVFWKSWIKKTKDERAGWSCTFWAANFWCAYRQNHRHGALFECVFYDWSPHSGHAAIVFYNGEKLRYFEPQTGQELFPTNTQLDHLRLVK